MVSPFSLYGIELLLLYGLYFESFNKRNESRKENTLSFIGKEHSLYKTLYNFVIVRWKEREISERVTLHAE